MEKLFQDKVVIVTGAGSGLGRAAAKSFAAQGAKVVVSDFNPKGGEETVAEINKAGGAAMFVKADVSQAEDCEAMVKKTVAKFGKLDIAVNNAGIEGERNYIAAMSVEGWNRTIATNLSSVFYCMKYEIPEMLKQGKGAIVNMASILGNVGFDNVAGYVASKHGVVGVTKTAAIEYSAKGLRINSIGPAFIKTPLLENASEEMKKGLIEKHPIGRLGEPNEVAELILWLCSDKASFITGSYYPIDGGYMAW